MPSNSSGQPVDPTTLARLRALIDQHGETAVWRAMRVSPTTGARALAGLGLSRGSRELIRLGLERGVGKEAA